MITQTQDFSKSFLENCEEMAAERGRVSGRRGDEVMCWGLAGGEVVGEDLGEVGTGELGVAAELG